MNRKLHYALLLALFGTQPAFAATASGPQQIKHAPHFSGATAARTATAAPARYDHFIVKYRDAGIATLDASLRERDLSAAASRAGLAQGAGIRAQRLGFRHARRLATGADVFVSSRALDASEAQSMLRELRADPAVQYAQPDYIKTKQDVTPNDPRFADLQWDFTDPVGGVRAPAAWDVGNGEGTVVAVLDTGYVDHGDLADNLVPGYDFISWYGQDDGTGFPLIDVSRDGDGRDADAHDPGDWDDDAYQCTGEPSSWHGTHVAGTVAAVANNAYGIAGLAYGAKVQPVRVLGHCGGLTSDIADGIVWASGGHVDGVPDNPTPAEVLNLSLGGSGKCSDDPATQEAIDSAVARGVTVVVAAGNDGANAAGFSPASCNGVITVGATGIDGASAWYSNYGTSVSLAAPGGNAESGSDPDNAFVWSLGNSGTHEPVASPEGDALLGMVGTSMASPHVAAVAALVQGASVAAGHGALTPAQVKALLLATVSPFAVQPSNTRPLGSGIVNAAAAITLAQNGFDEQDLAVQLASGSPATLSALGSGDSQLLRISVPAGARALNLRSYGGSGDVSLYVGLGSAPDADQHLAASARSGNTEAIVLPNPPAGDYYIRVQAEQVSANVTVLATYY